MPKRRRAALVADVRGWAFDINMRDLAAYVPGYDYDFLYAAELQGDAWKALRDYDLVYTSYHRWPIPRDAWPARERWLGALCSQYFRTEEPGPPSRADEDVVNRHAAFRIVNLELVGQLHQRCLGVVYLTNPVDTTLFDRPTEVTDEIVLEWNGNAGHHVRASAFPDPKGYHTILTPVLERTGLRAMIAEYGSSRIAHDDMPAFYRQANVALCTSAFEGASNSVMEAMASGLVVISTDVGNARELHSSALEHFGESGVIIVERTAEAFVHAIERLRARGPRAVLELGRINRAEISARWSWTAWASRYESFLRRACSL